MAGKKRLRWTRIGTVTIFTMCVILWTLLIVLQHSTIAQWQDDVHHRHPSPSTAVEASLEKTPKAKIDATFNGFPLSLRNTPFQSSFSCSGPDEFQATTDDAWMFRSCRFHNLCFDMSTRNYVVFLPDMEVQKKWNTTHAMALGGINPRWDLRSDPDKGSWKVRWFPDVRPTSSLSTYYQFTPDSWLIPFHSFAAHNVGHMLWDDFYPIFSLLRQFGLLDEVSLTTIVLLRQVLPESLYASCDIRRNKRQQCAANLNKFLPLLGANPSQFSTSKLFQFNTTVSSSSQDSHAAKSSPLVCAPRGLAGLGMLTDHGFRDHGWNENNTLNGYMIPPHNLGRGPNFALFAQMLTRNLFPQKSPDMLRLLSAAPPIQVTFSLLSSRDKDRRLDFGNQIAYLQQSLPSSMFRVTGRSLWEMTLHDQVQLVQGSHIFVTACGGGSMTATFLPRGSTLIMFYNPTGGIDFSTLGSLPNQPARLDWDLLNNAGHIRVHWLPIAGMNDAASLALLKELILHETHLIMNELTDPF